MVVDDEFITAISQGLLFHFISIASCVRIAKLLVRFDSTSMQVASTLTHSDTIIFQKVLQSGWTHLMGALRPVLHDCLL